MISCTLIKLLINYCHYHYANDCFLKEILKKETKKSNTNSVPGFPFLYILANICYLWTFLVIAILTWFWFKFGEAVFAE